MRKKESKKSKRTMEIEEIIINHDTVAKRIDALEEKGIIIEEYEIITGEIGIGKKNGAITRIPIETVQGKGKMTRCALVQEIKVKTVEKTSKNNNF